MENFKSGVYLKQGSYKSFQPNLINQPWKIEDMELLNLLSQADRALGRLDMYSEYIPNIDLYTSMHIFKEATESSRIEGTETNIEEALLDEDDVVLNRRDDWEEVQNYSKALNTAIDRLHTLPLSTRLIRDTHKILLQGVRGEHKLPGEFRTSQNWIGGATIRDAIFVPPVHTSIGELMSDLEKFIHNEDIFLPDFLKIALIHYQFETIHPFLDGNGRTGRLLITLYLVEKKILKKPVLYLSSFFEKNKALYYDNLTRVRDKHDIQQWCKFFLVGIIETAKQGVDTFNKILKLKEEVDVKTRSLGSRSVNAQRVIEHLYQKPLIDAHKVAKITGQTAPSAYKLIAELERIELIKEVTGGKRGKLYTFEKYLGLFR